MESSQLVGGAEDVLQPGQQSARWRLSEDPEDQKDSLWIWGLFKEPLYPFLLLELDLAQPVETTSRNHNVHNARRRLQSSKSSFQMRDAHAARVRAKTPAVRKDGVSFDLSKTPDAPKGPQDGPRNV